MFGKKNNKVQNTAAVEDNAIVHFGNSLPPNVKIDKNNIQNGPTIAIMRICLKDYGREYIASKIIEKDDMHLSPLVLWKEMYDWLKESEDIGIDDYSELILPCLSRIAPMTVLLRKSDIQSIDFEVTQAKVYTL